MNSKDSIIALMFERNAQDKRISALRKENEELRAENAELRKELETKHAE